ncbi:hypothetical protein HYH03_001719 [Edaphochlamys debaryana]|uniref:Uncharacterized protein n=1 Tax=Edaphochlamys debaryana TaxID=47281 RepID=A0A835YEF4_9CHLO|nr:hypothetical protein HYH03_001719 [Edaphochlamys debaryana]|eukprot:KAG2500137.1 hypothetical protein HYH03_001719 [Edaphochlamys debaryana]
MQSLARSGPTSRPRPCARGIHAGSSRVAAQSPVATGALSSSSLDTRSRLSRGGESTLGQVPLAGSLLTRPVGGTSSAQWASSPRSVATAATSGHFPSSPFGHPFFGTLILSEEGTVLEGSLALDAAFPSSCEALRAGGTALAQVWAGSGEPGVQSSLFRIQIRGWQGRFALDADPSLLRALGGLQPGARLVVRRGSAGRVEVHPAELGAGAGPQAPGPFLPSPSPAPPSDDREQHILGLVSLYDDGFTNTYFQGAPVIRAVFQDLLAQAQAQARPGPALEAEVWARCVEGGSQQLWPHRVTLYASARATRVTAVRSLVRSLGLAHGQRAELVRLGDGRVALRAAVEMPEGASRGRVRRGGEALVPARQRAAVARPQGPGRSHGAPPLPLPLPLQPSVSAGSSVAAGSAPGSAPTSAAGPGALIGTLRVVRQGVRLYLVGPTVLRTAFLGSPDSPPGLQGRYTVSLLARPGGPGAADASGDVALSAKLNLPQGSGCKLTGAAKLAKALGGLEDGQVVALWRLGGEGGSVLATVAPEGLEQ